MPVPGSGDETARLAALHRYDIVDSAPEEAFERLVRLACQVTGAPIALVSLVDADRLWFKAARGIAARELPRDGAFCALAILGTGALVVPDALADPRVAANPLVVAAPFARSYAGAPIRTADGFALGTVCALDTRPRSFDDGALACLRDLAAIAMEEIERRVRATDEALAQRVHVLEAVLESAGEGIMVADADGRLIVANPLARFVTGTAAPAADFPHDGWTREVGIYRADGRTILPMDEMPLIRAVRGEPTYGVELYVRNERIPDGRYLQVTGRTIRDGAGRPRGGVIVLSDISLLKHTQAQVTALALLDELTGLANRRAFRERLAGLGRGSARGKGFALTLVDIDHFKRINDVHGHDVGDQVLVAAARTLRAHVRRGDLVARIGGEEFCVLQADITEDAIALAEDLRIAIASIREPVAITASFGVCHTGIAPPEGLLKGADQALYRAKRAGRDRVVLAEASDLTSPGAPAS
jgi:diguanylate cyclase (GGDEF)-like protein